MLKESIISITIISAILQLIFIRKIIAECKRVNIKPPGVWNITFHIGELWKFSKETFNDELRSAIFYYFISWMVFLITIPCLLYYGR